MKVPRRGLSRGVSRRVDSWGGFGSGPIIIVISFATALLSQSVTVGADTMWLVAMGNMIITKGEIPHRIPFLEADTSEWVNVPVVGELLLAGIDRIGPVGLVGAQVIVVTVVLVAVARAAKQLGAGTLGICLALTVLVLGNLPTFGLVRAQIWSLPLFVVTSCLLRRESKSPSWHIWLAVPLIALWGNLHGAVLVGFAVIGAYLLLARYRHSPLTAVAVASAAWVSLWLTPGGVRSHEYYIGVLSNVAAERHEGLWAPADPFTFFGVLLIGSCGTLLVIALRRRLPLWEYAVVIGLALMTVQSARHGVWLALWLAPRAALGLRPRLLSPGAGAKSTWLAAPVVAICAALVVSGLAKRSAVVTQDRAVSSHLASVIGRSQTALAVSPISELLSVEGLHLWASNPIDALPRNRQAAFLDFLSREYETALNAPDPPDVLILKEEDPVPDGLVPSLVYGGFKMVPTRTSVDPDP